MTRFEASFPGTSGMSYFSFVGVSRRLVKALPVKVLSLDSLIVPRNAVRACTNKPTSDLNRDSSSILARILSKHGVIGDLCDLRSSEQNIPGFRNHVGQLLCTQGMDSAKFTQPRSEQILRFLGGARKRGLRWHPYFKKSLYIANELSDGSLQHSE